MAKEELIGTWKLITFEAVRENGDVVRPFGDNPRGLIVYDANGNMSAQLFHTDRQDFASDDRNAASDSEIRSAFLSSVAYFGAYSVNEDEGMVTHHVEGCLLPNWVGGDQHRRFQIVGNRLTLSPPPREVDGQQQEASLVWERAT